MLYSSGKFKSHRSLILILLLSLVATIAYSFIFRIHPVVDAKAYDRIAQNILAGNGFVEDPSVPLERDRALIRVGPLYQYFLADVYAIFGHHFEAVWIIQALLHVVSAYLVYCLALIAYRQALKRDQIALWSAAIFAFYPDLIEISAMLLSETVYLFLWVLFIYLFIWYLDKTKPAESGFAGWLRSLSEWLRTRVIAESWRREWLAVIGLALVSGLAVLARPPVLFVLPLIFVYLWSRRRWALSALYLLALLAVFTPWTARNYQIFDRIMPFGGAGNYNFWIGNHPGATGEQETGEEIANFLTENGALALYDASMPKFLEFVRGEPLEFVKLTALRINRYFSVIRPMGFWFYDSGWSQFAFIISSAAASVFLFVFGLYGISKLWRERTLVINYILWLILLTPLILFITVVETRYRFQIYPLLALFAAYGVVSLLSKRQWWRERALWVALVVIAGNGLLDAALSVEKLREKLGIWFG